MTTPQTAKFPPIAVSALVLCTTLLLGCNDEATPIPAQPQSAELMGIWEKTGYGDILKVDGDGAELYQYNRFGCLQADTLDNNDIAETFTMPALSDDGNSLTINPEGDTTFDVHLDRLTDLPSSCANESLITATSPTVTFEFLWHTFNDHYAFFSEREVNWNTLYADLRPLVHDDMNDEDLLEVIEILLSSLNDGHVQLETDNDDYNFVDYMGAVAEVIDTFEEQTQFSDIQEYASFLSDRYIDIRSGYLDNGSEKSAGGEDGDVFTWGTINQQTGYLRVNSMVDVTTHENGSLNEELNAVNAIMQSVLADLQSTNGMIIDVRSNGGGEDAVSLAIASYFTDQTRLAVAKRARSYLGETDEIEAYVSPANESPYLNPIAIIGSQDTASAAEIFLMAMSALPQVTLVGQNSGGILSDTLEKALPNGWEISLSNEVYTDYLGINHEAIGIQPSVVAETFSVEYINQNTDAAIDAALNVLGF